MMAGMTDKAGWLEVRSRTSCSQSIEGVGAFVAFGEKIRAIARKRALAPWSSTALQRRALARSVTDCLAATPSASVWRPRDAVLLAGSFRATKGHRM